MKKLITMKKFEEYARESNVKIYQVGYCQLQQLLSTITPDYYTAGIYGWNNDIYMLGDVAIVTGYRNLKGEKLPDCFLKNYGNKLGKNYTIENLNRFIVELSNYSFYGFK